MTRASHRSTFVGVAFAIVLLSGFSISGCAKPVRYPDSVPSTEIDLEPRCEWSMEEPIPHEESSAFANGETEDDGPTIEALPLGARWIFDPGSRSGLATLSWGFRMIPNDPGRGAHVDPKLAAALLRSAETAADPEAFRTRVSAFGGTLATHVEEDWLWLELRFPEAHHEEALRTLFEWRKTRPVDPEILERIRREVALAGLAESSSPDAMAEAIFRRVQPPPYGAAGSRERHHERRANDPDRIQGFLSSSLRPDGSVVLYSGPTDSPAVMEIRAAFEAELSDLAESGRSARAIPLSRALSTIEDQTIDSGKPEIHIIDRPDSAQVEILVGYSTVAPRNPDFAALEVLASLLGGNVGGRLFRDLRERQGLAYIINADQSAQGRFVVTTRARHERVVALLIGIEAHLRALLDVPLEACEIDMLERRMIGEGMLLADDPSGRSLRIRSDVALLGRPRSRSSATRRRLDAIRGDLQGAARRHLSGSPTIVLVGDADWLENDLASAFPERILRVFDANLEAIRSSGE